MNPSISMASDSAEFSRLVDEHQGRLKGYILSMIFDRSYADDVLQETNLVLCKKAAQFEPGTNFQAWAFRVAYFEVMRHRRKVGRDRLVFDEALTERIAEEAEMEDQDYEQRRLALAHCLRALGERQRDLVLRRYFEGESVQSIAAISKLAPNAVSQALFRARRSLMECVRLATPKRTR